MIDRTDLINLDLFVYGHLPYGQIIFQLSRKSLGCQIKPGVNGYLSRRI